MRRVGFIVNPIAGLGGRVGLKGTDGVAEQALAAGAKPTAPDRARAFAEALVGVTKDDPNLTCQWVTAGGDMGTGPLRESTRTESKWSTSRDNRAPRRTPGSWSKNPSRRGSN